MDLDAPHDGPAGRPRGSGSGRAERGEVLVLNKVSAILDFLLAERRELGPTEIAAAIKASKTTTYRLLRSIEDAGLLDRTPVGTYRLGVKLIAFGRAVESRLDVRREAQPIIERLARTTRQTTFLFVPGDTGALCILRVSGEDVEVLAVGEGEILPYHVGAAPMALLAFLGEKRIYAYVASRSLERLTEATVTEPDQLQRELGQIRERGWWLSWGDVTPGVAAVGAPVFGPDRRVVAAISVSGISTHLGSRAKPRFVAELLAASEELSSHLGSAQVAPPVRRSRVR